MTLISELKELPVLSIKEAEIISKISNVYIDKTTKTIAYLVFDRINQKSIPNAINYELISEIGDHFIMILNKSDIEQFIHKKSLNLEEMVEPFDSTVILDKGHEIGRVIDLEFSVESGEMTKLILDTNKTFTSKQILAISDQHIIVTNHPKEYTLDTAEDG
ncbi:MULTISPECIES: PRC-barrel domain-containing protein [unclassified Enterococcus]|uniref:PRC-barrel domain-containing protein n=1 Tax=unclassified Enterococcus TaxID=2608891 RepID=UPI00155619A9|nr:MULTISPECIES: PRC-barrel domain-containing protein [unclassified Enterococcus]MBS7576275.1 PRC-barrel domain-containing protein [Enterococcus sp. MMGLQ5-2]MBS7583508.1 PRC-barrel domain-containing protein [Enterococcus sp. MMGLQ5-1]NPD11370.1 hypothetical protein [Enterococcus sp. MMGLQ5-1]NPD36113.1 hypothetical protein [Enterococcus sp. MMGLQ5-2]